MPKSAVRFPPKPFDVYRFLASGHCKVSVLMSLIKNEHAKPSRNVCVNLIINVLWYDNMCDNSRSLNGIDKVRKVIKGKFYILSKHN